MNKGKFQNFDEATRTDPRAGKEVLTRNDGSIILDLGDRAKTLIVDNNTTSILLLNKLIDIGKIKKLNGDPEALGFGIHLAAIADGLGRSNDKRIVLRNEDNSASVEIKTLVEIALRGGAVGADTDTNLRIGEFAFDGPDGAFLEILVDGRWSTDVVRITEDLAVELLNIYPQFGAPQDDPPDGDPPTDPPVPSELTAVADDIETDEDTSIIISVLDNDLPGPSGGIVLGPVGDPLHGTVTVNVDGTITYLPDAEFNGEDSFTYEIQSADLEALTASEANARSEVNLLETRVRVNEQRLISAEAEIPRLENRANETRSRIDELELELSFLQANLDALRDADVVDLDSSAIGNQIAILEFEISFARNSLQDEQTNLSAILNDLFQERASVASLTTALENDRAALPDAQRSLIEATAAVDSVVTSTAQVTITVVPVNDNPTANPDFAVTNEDISVTFDVLGNDFDLEGDAIFIETIGDVQNGSARVNPDGTITYTPKENYNGTETIEYFISDGRDGTAQAVLSVTVRPVQDDPIAVDDKTTVIGTPGTFAVIDVLENDSDPDGEAVQLVSASDPANGSVEINPDGTITYRPDEGFFGADNFEYTIGSNGPSVFANELAEARAERGLKANALVDLANEEMALADELSAVNETINALETAISNLNVGLGVLFEELGRPIDVIDSDTLPRRPDSEIIEDITAIQDLIARDDFDLTVAKGDASQIEAELAEFPLRRLEAQAELDAATDAVAAVEAQIAIARQDTATVTIDVVADDTFVFSEVGVTVPPLFDAEAPDPFFDLVIGMGLIV